MPFSRKLPGTTNATCNFSNSASLPNYFRFQLGKQCARRPPPTSLKRDGEIRTDLILSARFKDSKTVSGSSFSSSTRHRKNPREVLLQLLEYQNAIYQNTEAPSRAVIPVIIYHGKVKDYSGPVKLHDILSFPKKAK